MASRHARTNSAAAIPSSLSNTTSTTNSSNPPTSRSDVRRQLFRPPHSHTQSTSAIPQTTSSSSSSSSSAPGVLPNRSRSFNPTTSSSGNTTTTTNGIGSHTIPTPFDDDLEDTDGIIVYENDGASGGGGGYDITLEHLMRGFPRANNNSESSVGGDTDMLLSESLNSAQLDMARKLPAVVSAVQAALKAKVASLQSDNWMYEAESEES